MTENLAEFREAVAAEPGLLDSLQQHRVLEPEDELLSRFLVARRGKIKDALKLLKEDLKWRDELDMKTLRESTAKDLLNCSNNQAGYDLHNEWFPHGLLGYDYQNRPIVYKRYGKTFWAHKMEAECQISLDLLIKYNIWTIERLAAAMGHKGKWNIIIDMDTWSITQANMQHVKYCRALADTDANHFPERLCKVFIINAPGVFSGFYKMVRGWLDPVTRAKVNIFGGKASYEPEMSNHLDLALLPEHLGGKTVLRYEPHSMDPQPQEAQDTTN